MKIEKEPLSVVKGGPWLFLLRKFIGTVNAETIFQEIRRGHIQYENRNPHM